MRARSSPSLRLNASLSAHVRAGEHDGALLLLRRMHRRGVPLDSFSFTPAFSACAALSSARGRLAGRNLHALALKTGALSGSITCTALLDAYAKCAGEPPDDDATRLFDEMPSRDTVAWNALLACLSRRGRAADVLTTFRRMALPARVRATEFTLATLLTACGSLTARQLGEQVHAAAVVAGACDSVVLSTTLVGFYADCGLVDRASTVFDLHLRRGGDEAARNALIAGWVRNGRRGEAFAALREVAAELNAKALTAALAACELRRGREIHGAAVRRAITGGSPVLCDALSDMYARCGELEPARRVFEHAPARDAVSWAGLIRAYGRHGRAGEAVALFRKMPGGADGGALLAVLSACGHAGLVEEGSECLLAARAGGGVEPAAEHRACFIDLLGRAGRVEEAWRVFDGAGPEVCACVAVLNACAANMDPERGLVAAERLLGLAATGGGGAAAYVALAKFYAGVGMWEKAEEMRRSIRSRGLRKELGFSRQID
ncbi:pentatricopeptide repeat-containing protein At5g66500, mitochondrial-like [Wolffia australiana]